MIKLEPCRRIFINNFLRISNIHLIRKGEDSVLAKRKLHWDNFILKVDGKFNFTHVL